MKLNTARKPVQSGGMNISVRFGMDMNGKSFGLLTSGLYSDIITTIVRELSTNAHDSHLAAVKAGLMPEYIPFEVSCPTAFDPHFMVRDFGTGLRYFKYDTTIVNEHEGESTIFIDGDVRKDIAGITMLILNENETIDMTAILYDTDKKRTVIRIPGDYEGENIPVEFDDTLVLYSTYFRSTKEDTNDYTGAFGLGSKTPLAYTDNFLVTNRFNGTKRVYNIYTNEDNEPRINLMMSADDDEGNGLEVKLGVDPDDYFKFKRAIVSQLLHFDPRPVILNDEVTFPTLIHKGEHFLLYENMSDIIGHQYSRYHAVVGNNAYEISNVNNSLFQHDLVLRFAVGEVMVTASREELKYDEGTRELIQEREQEAIDEYTAYVLDTIDDNGMTDYEKAAFLNQHHKVLNLKSDKVRERVGNPNYNYRDSSITIPLTGWGCYSTIHWDEHEKDDGTVTYSFNKFRTGVSESLRLSSYRAGKVEKIESWRTTITPDSSIIIFVRDNSYAFLKKISHHISEAEIDTHENDIYVLDLFNAADNTDAAFDAIKRVAGHCVTFIKLSDITLPKLATVPTGQYTTPVARMFNYERPSWLDEPGVWAEVYTPLTRIDRDAYIIETYRNKIQESSLSWDDRQFLRHYLEAEFDIDTDVPILALTTARYEKALEYGFKPISELIDELKKNVSVPRDLVNARELDEVMSEIGYSDVIRLIKSRCSDESLKGLDKDSNVAKLLRAMRLYELRYEARTDEFKAVDRLMSYMDGADMPEPSDFVQPAIDNLREILYNVNNELILLTCINGWEISSEEKSNAVIKYINLLNNTGESK
jgi:hypothetical protein